MPGTIDTMGAALTFSDDQVFEAIRALVADGEYLDELYGLPGRRLTGAGCIRKRADGRHQRVYQRGTPEFLDGGFGPGYGLLGLRGGHRDDGWGLDAVSLRREWTLPRASLLPLCHWGCGIYSFVDLASPEAAMWAYDPNPVDHDPLDQALVPQSLTLASWLGRWTAGRLYQPTLEVDASTGAWRAATDDEIEMMLAAAE